MRGIDSIFYTSSSLHFFFVHVQLFCGINNKPQHAAGKRYKRHNKKRVIKTVCEVCDFAKHQRQEKCAHLSKEIHGAGNCTGIVAANV